MTAAIPPHRGFDTRDVPTIWFIDLRFPIRSSAALASRAKSLVHVTSISQGRKLVPHRGFGLSNVKMKTSPRLTIPRIPTRPLCASSPSYAPRSHDHDPRDHSLIPRRGYGDFNTPIHASTGFLTPRIPILRYTDSWPPLWSFPQP